MDKQSQNTELNIGIDVKKDILQKRDDLINSLFQILDGFQVDVKCEANNVSLYFKDIVVCRIEVGEGTYRFFDISEEWADNTRCLCLKNEGGGRYYYVDDIEDCIGECERLVKFEEKKKGIDLPPGLEIKMDKLFPINTIDRELMERVISVFKSVDNAFLINVTHQCVSIKREHRIIFTIWPKHGWVEVALCVKAGEIKRNDIVYDVSEVKRFKGRAGYAIHFDESIDEEKVRNILRQVSEVWQEK